MGARIFGDAGDKVVVEEYLTGVEASMLCLSMKIDSANGILHRIIREYLTVIKGPNTGGMGSYSPSLVFTPELESE